MPARNHHRLVLYYMRLKQLEITGFKSFPDKSVIEFPSGVSAIVGPNGCGKSNIIDAIKWVMGEQSIKQLRGKSMGDVIFAGTAKRLQLNMAEVSLILSNDTPSAADDRINQLTEIMVTRRLFRSGESAYLINKQPCRLKDIHNVFVGSGMGSKSCAIVQQGNIGAITEASPEERREYIEEAAGVTRYKTRKNEAVIKVKSTNQNLLRLNDIIDEIKKQMNSLRRQARKAQRHKDFREHAKNADILITAYYYEQYSRQIESTQDLLNQLREKDSLHTSELEELNAALEKIKKDRFTKDQTISRKKNEKSNTQRRIDTLKNDLKHLKDEEKRLYSEIIGLDEVTIELETKNQKITDEIAQESVNQKKMIALQKETKDALAQTSFSSKDIRGQLAGLQQKLEGQRKHLMELMTQKAKFQNIFKNAESNKDHLQQKIRQLKNDETKITQNILKLQKKETDAKNNLASLNADSESINHRIAEKKEALEQSSVNLGNQIKKVNSLLNDRNNVKSKFAALQKLHDNYEWYKDGVKAIMTNKDNSAQDIASLGNSGILGIMADSIEPEPAFEIALEAILGESLQYILVKNQKTGISSINYLKGTNAGRGGFIPISKFTKSGGPVKDANLLLNHVTVKPGYEHLMHELLENIAVAEDFDEALKMCDQDNGYQKVVTKNGDIIFSNGILIGGSKDKLSGIYEKKRELKQLKTRIANLTDTLAVEENVRNDLESEVKNLEIEIQKLTVQKNSVEINIRNAEKELYQATETLKHSANHLEIITLEKENLMGEATDIDDEIAKHDSALNQITRDEKSVEKNIKEISDQVSSLKDQIYGFDQKEMDLKLELTKLSAELENTEKSLARLADFLAEGVKQLEQIKKDITIKTQRRKNATLQIQEHVNKLSEISDGLNAIDNELKDYETDFQTIITRIDKTDTDISQTKNVIDEIKQKGHQLELELSSFKIKRENVANRFLETYSLSFSQILAEYRNTVNADDFSIEKAEYDLSNFKKKIERIGDVNIGAIEAYEEQKTRYDFLTKQRDDLVDALENLQRVIKKINKITQKLFMEMFHKINEKFKEIFPKLFDGGDAWLELTQPTQPLETGIELMIHPPGKKVTRLSLLSGGEKALSAIAFIFSIFLINPASYCLLDEIDAPLDEANTHRFNELLKIIGEKSQIIMISHNKRSMEFSDMLFGVTMGESGVSKLVSVDIEKLTNQTRSKN